MLKSRMGTTVEFQKLDEWVFQMTVKVPHTKGMKVVASPKFAISQLLSELVRLEQAKPQPESA